MKDERAMRLATLLHALQSEKMRFNELRTEHKDTLERLENQISMLKHEILTGQANLLDPPEAA